jgi:hypothetical protein
VDLAQLSDRYDRLWTKAERLVEAFLDQHLAAIEIPPMPSATTTPQSANAKPVRLRRSKSRSAASPSGDSKPSGNTSHSPIPPFAPVVPFPAPPLPHSPIPVSPTPPFAPVLPSSIPVSPTPAPPAPAVSAMREIYIAVQCLKRIHEGRFAVQTGGSHDLQSVGPTDSAKTIAEDISRRIRALCDAGRPNGDDDDSV